MDNASDVDFYRSGDLYLQEIEKRWGSSEPDLVALAEAVCRYDNILAAGNIPSAGFAALVNLKVRAALDRALKFGVEPDRVA